jgi:hypothetical protein
MVDRRDMVVGTPGGPSENVGLDDIGVPASNGILEVGCSDTMRQVTPRPMTLVEGSSYSELVCHPSCESILRSLGRISGDVISYRWRTYVDHTHCIASSLHRDLDAILGFRLDCNYGIGQAVQLSGVVSCCLHPRSHRCPWNHQEMNFPYRDRSRLLVGSEILEGAPQCSLAGDSLPLLEFDVTRL